MTDIEGVSDPWIENQPGVRPVAELLSELWSGREVLSMLVKRDISARTKQSFLGLFWPVVQPLVNAVTFLLVFNQLAGVTTSVPYILFAFVGSMTWSYVSIAASASVSSMQYWAGLVTKLYMPRIVLPVASILAAGLGFVVSSVVFVGLVAVFGGWPGLAVILTPVWIAAMVVMMAGYAFFFATLQVRYRDTARVTALLTQTWLYASPVAYPVELVSDRLQAVYHLNPLTGILGALRWSTIGSSWSHHNFISFAVVIVLLFAGLRLFASHERSMADFI